MLVKSQQDQPKVRKVSKVSHRSENEVQGQSKVSKASPRSARSVQGQKNKSKVRKVSPRGTGWRGWVSGELVGDVPSKFPCKFPLQFPLQIPLSICVCLFVKCLFVCFQTGFPLPVYFLFLPSLFKQPLPYPHICCELSEIESEYETVAPLMCPCRCPLLPRASARPSSSDP